MELHGDRKSSSSRVRKAKISKHMKKSSVVMHTRKKILKRARQACEFKATLGYSFKLSCGWTSVEKCLSESHKALSWITTIAYTH